MLPVRRSLQFISIFLTMAVLHGCGTTSSLQSVEDVTTRPDLAAYERVVVGDFTDRSTEAKTFKNTADGAAKKSEYMSDVEAGSNTFADYIVAKLRKAETFTEVLRGTDPQPGDLYIEGDITRFQRGNAAAKFVIGLGAGSTYFDAVVRLRDGASADTLGTVVVDKNSWVLGGVISAAQNIEGFMRAGATKVAAELSAAKSSAATK